MLPLNDLLLVVRAANLLADFRRNAALRAAARRGTAQMLRWQSDGLCRAAAATVEEAERLVNRSVHLRQAARALRR
jgi:hypothetical protein